MSDDRTSRFEESFALDDALMNAVLRKMARRALIYATLNVLLLLVVSALVVRASSQDWVTAWVDGTDDVLTVVGSAFALILLYLLWVQARAVGTLVAHVRRPDTTICKGLVDGVSFGPCKVSLSEDAISWELRDLSYSMHLAGLFKPEARGNLLFLRNNIAEVRFAPVSDTASWIKSIKERQETAQKTGWSLPEGEDWQSYSLPRTGFQAAQTKAEHEKTPKGSLLGTSFSVALFSIGTVFLFSRVVSGINDFGGVIALVLLMLLPLILYFEIPTLTRGFRRKFKGMSPYGRDVLGATHGDSVYRIGKAGIDIHRPFQRKLIRWSAITSVEQIDGWLALRAGDTTLDVVPSSNDIVDALGAAGFNVPNGPWERAKGPKTWEKAA